MDKNGKGTRKRSRSTRLHPGNLKTYTIYIAFPGHLHNTSYISLDSSSNNKELGATEFNLSNCMCYDWHAEPWTIVFSMPASNPQTTNENNASKRPRPELSREMSSGARSLVNRAIHTTAAQCRLSCSGKTNGGILVVNCRLSPVTSLRINFSICDATHWFEMTTKRIGNK